MGRGLTIYEAYIGGPDDLTSNFPARAFGYIEEVHELLVSVTLTTSSSFAPRPSMRASWHSVWRQFKAFGYVSYADFAHARQSKQASSALAQSQSCP